MTRITGDAGTTTSEVWFGGPDRQRTIQQVTGPNGASVSRQDVVFNGPETWIEDTQNGVTRVIHTTGATLFLSPRTVGFHLHNVFPKLQVTTRAQLAHVLGETEGTRSLAP